MKAFISLLISAILYSQSDGKVIELSDRFLEFRGETTWIIMFYAPWCGHCKKLEPIWSQVSQELFNTDIKVGKVDCTRFTSLAPHFNIKGFPTILFIRGETQIFFKGDRTKEDIVGFSLRMASDIVPHLSASMLNKKKEDLKDFFLYVGERITPLWDCFYSLALEYRHFHYVFSIDESSFKELALRNGEGVYVYKEKEFVKFPGVDDAAEGNVTALNATLDLWMNNERFPFFMKITRGNFRQVWKVEKLLALFVVEENKIGKLEPSTEPREGSEISDYYAFKSSVEEILRKLRRIYESRVHFVWTASPDIVHSIAMKRLELPAIVVVDQRTMNFFEPDFPAADVDERKLTEFLDSVLEGSATVQGGDSYLTRVYRSYFDLTVALQELWLGNPVLTTVLFGLPLGFFSLLCYSVWCSDIMDADDDEEPADKPQTHEKCD